MSGMIGKADSAKLAAQAKAKASWLKGPGTIVEKAENSGPHKGRSFALPILSCQPALDVPSRDAQTSRRDKG